MPFPTGKRDATPAERNRLWRLSTMGFTLATEVAAGTLLGWLVDWGFGFDRIFIVVGAIAGVLVGLSSFIRAALAENRRSEQKRR